MVSGTAVFSSSRCNDQYLPASFPGRSHRLVGLFWKTEFSVLNWSTFRGEQSKLRDLQTSSCEEQLESRKKRLGKRRQLGLHEELAATRRITGRTFTFTA